MPLGEEALVVPHHQLAVELLHGLEHHADCDEDGDATEGILDIPRFQHDERDDGDTAWYNHALASLYRARFYMGNLGHDHRGLGQFLLLPVQHVRAQPRALARH